MKTSEPKSSDEPSPENQLSHDELKGLLSTLEGSGPVFDLRAVLFPKQLPFGLDTARWQTAVCTRRAGKTFGIAAKLLDVAKRKPGCVALYVTKSRINAKRIVWDTLKMLNETFALGGTVAEGELCLVMPNGSKVYLSGADHESEIEKFRGLALGIALIDEAQMLPAYIEKMVNEVLAPALMDFNGSLVLVGTPGPVPIGYFHECSHSAKWSHHAWTAFDNPHIQRKSGKTPKALLDEELERRGVTVDDPVIQREWFGRWVLDENSLVFRFDPARNGRTQPDNHHTQFVMGIDLGFDDADAICVLGWSDESPELDLVYEMVMPKQTITTLMKQVEEVYARFKPQAVVCDMGGLGKKIAEELQQRTGIPIEAADKQRKLEHIELLNDAMRTGRFFAPADSRFAADCMLVEWDKTNPEKPKISERFHSDICDAVLYAWRHCQQWLYVPPKRPAAKINSPEWHAEQLVAQQAAIDEQFEAEFEKNAQDQREAQEMSQWE